MPDAPTTIQSTPTDLPPLTAKNVTGRAISAILLYRLAILELAIMCTIAAGGYFLGAMGDTDWPDLTPGEKFKFKVGMWMVVLPIVRSFLSQTIANLKKGNTLPPDLDGANGGTGTWTRRATQTDTVQVTAPPVPAPVMPPMPGAPGK
jgi:hypothetical protein